MKSDIWTTGEGLEGSLGGRDWSLTFSASLAFNWEDIISEATARSLGEEPLASGVFADWHIVDWYSTKVMSAYVAGGDRTLRSDTVLDWADAPVLWQRRAAVVSFVPHAKQPRKFRQDLPERLLIACDGNINASPERFAHTGVGWVLREMSVAEPTLVADYVAERPQLASEARRMATARLRPGPYRRR